MSMWHISEDTLTKEVHIKRNGVVMKAEGHFKGDRPAIGRVIGAKPLILHNKQYIVVRELHMQAHIICNTWVLNFISLATPTGCHYINCIHCMYHQSDLLS